MSSYDKPKKKGATSSIAQKQSEQKAANSFNFGDMPDSRKAQPAAPVYFPDNLPNSALLPLLEKTASTKRQPNPTGIQDALKQRFEQNSGFSFDDVRVHYNSDKPARLQALAYTQGNQVYLGPGQEQHLEHELGHVAQQKQGRVQPTERQGAVSVNTDPLLEREADRGLLPAEGGTAEGLPVVQKQEGLPLNCPVYVNLAEGCFEGIIIGVSQQKETLYDVRIEDEGDRVFLGKDVLHGVISDNVTARERLMNPLNFVSLTPFDKAPSVISGRDTTITGKKEMPTTVGPVFHAQTLTRAAHEAYGQNKSLDGTAVFHLGSNSGALLERTQGVYKVVYLEKRNLPLMKNQTTGQFGQAEINANFQVDQVITTGLTGCSFIAMTDAGRSFLAVAHLDTGDEIKNVINEMQSRQLKPTLLYASIVDGTGNSLEVSRVREIAKTFAIQKIRILNRDNPDRASANSLNIIGIDLGTGKSPAAAGEKDAAAAGGRPMSVFGEMGSDKDIVRGYLKGWLRIWNKECKPEWKLVGQNPVKTEPIRHSLSSIGLERFFDMVLFVLRQLGKGDVYAGINMCMTEDTAFNAVLEIIYKPLERKAFSEIL